MAMSMGPPLLPGYSLRVQLFSPNAHNSKDSPIRCFRVVTSPDVTVREFCQETSRIHEINYGEPLAVKKVQDEEGFDITQSEVLGTLFATTSIIRVVQASTNPSIRDSVPPSSALRFDPAAGRKRGASARPESHAASSSWKPNKRQRVSNLDPDEPLPSREDESEVAGPSRASRRTPSEKIIPDSQGSIALGVQKVFNNTRQVRQDLPMIPETPSPSPPPEVLSLPSKKQPIADTHTPKAVDNPKNEDSSFLSNVDNSSPLREASARAQSHVSRAKSASYHIQRATERGRSVSTAATSPLSLDQLNNFENGVNSSSKRKRPSPKPILPKHNGTPFRSHNEDSIYENIVSDDEGSAVFRRKREASKAKNSPRPSTDRTQNGVNTPPNASRRTSAAREPTTTPGELPLTPNSEERQRQQQKKQLDEARKARIAAAEAAEQRKKEAEDRQAEELKTAEKERIQREEHERHEVEAFNRAQAELKQKLIDQAARAEAERIERDKKEAEEAKRSEEARIAREEAEETQRPQDARLAKRKAEEERLAKEKAAEETRVADEQKLEEERRAKEVAVAEAQRLLDKKEKSEREKSEAAAEELKNSELKKVNGSSGSEGSRHSKSASPAATRMTPILPPKTKPQTSSTAFIPSGRKSNLKRSLSSQSLRSSSPANPKSTSDVAINGVGVEDQLPLPIKLNRKVSFNEETIAPRKETPILPPGRRVIPGGVATTPKAAPQKDATPKPANKASILPPGRQSSTPIPAPKASRSSKERSATPMTQTKISPQNPTTGTGLKPSVKTQPLKKYGRAAALQKKGKSLSVEQPTVQDAASDAESEADVADNTGTKEPNPAAILPKVLSSNTTIKFEPQDSRNEIEEDQDVVENEDETQSHNSSPRDSRSPIVFRQHPEPIEIVKPQRAASPASESDEDGEEEEEEAEDKDTKVSSDDASDDQEDEDDIEPVSTKKADALFSKSDKAPSSESDSEVDAAEESDQEETEVQVLRSSPPEFPPRQRVNPSLVRVVTKQNRNNSKDSLSHMSINTQDEVDQQLTSSMYEALPAPSSSVSLPIPASSAVTKPKFGVGVSLSSLLAAKSTLSSSYAARANDPRSSSQKLQLPEEEEEDGSEEEEEEESDSDESSSDEEPGPSKSKSTASTMTSKISLRAEDAQKDSEESDSDSDSNSDNAVDEERTRQELLGQIDALNSKKDGDSQSSFSSPQAYRSSTQAKKTPQKKSGSQFITGYNFSQPA
ncbi:uncharacterized protein LY89DRAFT_308024 [Mollisia scopiformis]|uniref:Nucleolar protein Dnt1-like N-terminal domain-containing protein n=1 Tax=Mollisia scopiformis TaxID=149040 RepID=A0A194XR81_MOLSC|nr:uncharacterized protein LY89DRAFT_308024 [Mollisia scopiformis]KUJ22698.1 hypothetical protein LY89DRAFT_308024 [Mollisia scopiformis]